MRHINTNVSEEVKSESYMGLMSLRITWISDFLVTFIMGQTSRSNSEKFVVKNIKQYDMYIASENYSWVNLLTYLHAYMVFE